VVALHDPVRSDRRIGAFGLDLLERAAECQRAVRALVEQLVEGVLAVRAGLAPEHLAGLVVHRGAVQPDRLAVALHGQLLQIGREPVQVLRVRQHRVRLRAEERVVPDVEQPEQRGHVAFHRLGPEVLVDGVVPGQHLGELLLADRHHHRQAHR
jgi:hypothetical protein